MSVTSRLTELMQAQIARFINELGARRVLIAYSGGVDSGALLHAASQSRAQGNIEVAAVHINHGLHAAADEWEQFCRRTAKRFAVSFQSLRVNIEDGCSPEEAARNARYAALKTLTHSGDMLMTAHHRDDQAETVLLQLLRGGGPEGLAAMPACTRFGDGHLARPLLAMSRAQIERYARDHRLEWLDDPANEDLRYDRNYLCRQLAPVLHERWPAWQETLSRAARHQADACELIKRIAQRHYSRCRDAGGTLSVESCLELHEVERKAVLRHWIKQARLPTPSERQLRQLIGALLCGNARAGALVRWPGVEVRHYRGRLYAMAPLAPPADRGARRWCCGADLELPEIGARLTWRQLAARAPDLSDASSLIVRLRRGGEKCAFGGGHKDLKKIFQERGVPPWQRNRVPLVYDGDELRVVWSSM